MNSDLLTYITLKHTIIKSIKESGEDKTYATLARILEELAHGNQIKDNQV